MKTITRALMVPLLFLMFTESSFAAHGITKWPDNKAGAVSLTFDDTLPSHLSLVIPALNARRIKGTFFLVTNEVLDWVPWKNASLTGHEIESHTKSHPDLTTLSPVQIQDELAGSKVAIDTNIPSRKSLYLAYPFGESSSTVQLIAYDYYLSARGIVCGLNQDLPYFYDIYACSPDTGGGVYPNDVYVQADASANEGKWLVVYLHSIDGTGYGSWSINQLEAYLDYLKTKNLWVGTFGTPVKYIKERESATLSVSSSSSNQIVLRLTDTLDDAIYDQPLTLRSEVPSNWAYVTVVQGSNSTTVNSTVEGTTTVIYYNAVPDHGLISLTRATLSGSHGITKWPDNKMGAVSLTFDDGCTSHLSLGIPALDARGLKGTFFLITDQVGSWGPWIDAANSGHELGSHSKSHPYLTILSPAQVQDELAGSKIAIDAHVTSQQCLTLAYPYGDENDSVATIAGSLFMASRGVSCALNTAPYDFNRVRACSPDPENFDDIYAQADAAEQQGAWSVTFIHSLNGGSDCWGNWNIGLWTNYLDYLKTKNLWIGTFGTAVKYIKEREAATLSVSSSSSNQIVLSLADSLDDAVYDQPLTLRSEVPSGWTFVSVQQGSGSATVNSTVEGTATVIYYQAVPDRGPISLTSAVSPGNLAPNGIIDTPIANVTLNVGDSISFTGTGTDADGNLPLSYRWNFGAGSGIADSTAEDPGAKQFNNPGIYSVTFTVTDMLGLPDPTPAARVITVLGGTASGTRLWLPAVSGSLSGNMIAGTDYALNSLAGTLVYPNTTDWNTDNHTQADGVAYTVGIPAAGTWYLWARMYYPGTTAQPTNDPNSFWVSIDGGAAKILGNRTDVDRTWHWEGAAVSLLSLGNLSAGSHTLRVWNREARELAGSKLSPRLDVLFLTNESGYTPNDVDAAKALSPAPAATTNTAASITFSGATVNGGVNPNGQATTAWFEWGTSPTLATFSATSNQSLGSGTTSQAVSAALSGLTPGTTYYFRAAASNASGTTKGTILSFTTTIPLLPPAATTNAAASITISGATVSGGVNPNGQATTAWFEWGTSPALATFSVTSNQSVGSGTTSVSVNAALSGLASGTTYYFRAAASNATGTTKGTIASFTTTVALAPTASTNAAASITISGATLNGGVNPNGQATTAWFEWGTSPTLATFSATSNQSLGSGTTSQAVSAALSGLASGTTYYFRVAASNAAGTVKGSILSFATSAVAPMVTTNAATSVTSGDATVNGGVNPNAQATTAWFEWGTDPTLATFSVTSNQSVGSGTTSQAVSGALSGLSPGTTYYFRAAASNATGTTKGAILSFATSAVAPMVTTNAATSVTSGGATMNGGVNPNGAATTAWFEWGTSPALATFSVTSNQSVGSGTTSQAVSGALSGLSPGTTYYFRVAASNAAGTVKGTIRSFATSEIPIGSPPYPPSPIIKDIIWAPSSTIIRQAQGSDNWPLTWGDDDNLYAAYGDGNGFDPMIPERLSLGFAAVSGSPPAFSGINFRSPTGEQTGDGEAGKKASGMLMMDNVLYMWARNAGNSQLAWSSDYGRTWSWSTWKFTTSFAFPTFLNFGKNYSGARDEYVYVYSPDNDNAYLPADRMVLARVPKGAITNQAAYEFFNGLDASSNPVWTIDIAQRQGVFTHHGNSQRSSISYHAPSGRYLWIQTLPGGDPFLGGGFGVYDAPEPWGPWTTAYFTEEWDVAPGDMGSFPTKWMSDDGKTLYMVFSGNDSFSVRMATLLLGDPANSAPTATTNAATSITISGATVNGGVNPNGQATTAWFEWGTDPTLATFSVTSNQSVGSGTTSVSVNAALSGLASRDDVLLPGGGLQRHGNDEGGDPQLRYAHGSPR